MSPSESPRRRARELVLQALYAHQHGDMEPDDDFSNIVSDKTLPGKALDFARQLYRLICENQEWADKTISRLAEHWDINRMAIIDLNILRMATVEIRYIVDVPVKVVLNEAIELARKYSTDESSAFVNGILDSFVNQTEHDSQE
ncbi:MAG: transcription antitermination factor NusB [candidate division Zixibacteria bacterium]|nr:transcription antitermination factor NusB [candidate division Zixibacteria bacterium]